MWGPTPAAAQLLNIKPTTAPGAFTVFANPLANNTMVFRYVFPATPGTYYAFALGSSMDDLDVMVAWYSSQKQVVLSRRKASGHTMPTDVGANQDLVYLNTTKVSDRIMVTFMRPMASKVSQSLSIDVTKSQPAVWAVGAVSGDDTTSAGGRLAVHGAGGKGAISAQWSNPTTQFTQFGSKVTTLAGVNAPVAIDDTAASRALVRAHGVLMVLAWLVAGPLGILVARFFKKKLGIWWFRIHAGLMVVGALCGTIVGFILVYVAVNKGHGNHMSTKVQGLHGIFGILVLVLTVIQTILGVVIDKLFDFRRKKVPWHDVLHWWLGRCIVVIGILNIPYGLYVYMTLEPTTGYVWIGLVAAWVVILIITTGFFQSRVGQVHDHVSKA
ncbi:hypothetical protein CXG81DRAFT_17318 [Caulochytrium protostelioides]|uniref:Cytochrome b561 domain-containing protein n=1 Tax=Caulochytrium protostelioides TaxID=1555241 RepID=A0A4P9XCA5_9FUNG|nr:hypothetical protein CXG81DRAFT_17318 [Caulochytrium protostelioides]|eukprot:RKP03056.1 hypothetical protein CXG81DRAFT_17318 [Caulochytrium protostelioides]